MSASAEPHILHVDMDAFFAAVEVQRDPMLAGRPVVVGGAGDRGVVASASYEARAYGIRSAMPSAQARRLCPHAVFVHGDYAAYAECSRRLHDVLASFTPLVEGVALDEAFLDVAGARRLHGTGPQVAVAVRERVRSELGLGCSVGVATSKLVAKLASKAAKPHASLRGTRPGAGVVVVPAGEERRFLAPLPVEALSGVGPATTARLRRLGVVTVGDLAALPVETLVASVGQAAGRQLAELARGHDTRPVEPGREVKSVGHEETFAVDLTDADQVHREVVRMADAVASRLRAGGLAGRTVTLKVRFSDFCTITRSHTLPGAVDTTPEIVRAAAGLAAQVDPAPGVRLLGVSVSNLAAGAVRQLTLDEVGAPAWEHASRAVDEIRARYGQAAVGPAALVGRAGLWVKRRGDQQWGPRDAEEP